MARVLETQSTLKGKEERVDRALLFDNMTELAERMAAGCKPLQGESWLGGLTDAHARRFLMEGEESRVAASDAYMAKLEDKFEFRTERFQTINAISGGAANVGAYLAGSPLAMRRRQRVMDDMAPLTIVVDTTSSGGIEAAKLEKRGATLLALVRLLAARRPVTLYAGAALGPHGGRGVAMTSCFTRIETAPLDVARAAFLLGHPGAARGIGYGIIQNDRKSGDYGAWPYDSIHTLRTYGAEYWGRVFAGSEVLYMPPVFGNELSTSNPEKWLEEMLGKYGGLHNDA